MARFAKGSRALAISDRSGAAFPYREMVQEWTGAWVHISEFEPKQPQLQPHPVGADPQGLMHARPEIIHCTNLKGASLALVYAPAS